MIGTLLPVAGMPLMSDESQPSTVTVRIDSELARKARIICAHSPGRGGKALKVVDYLDSLLRKAIEQRYDEVLRGIAAEQQAEAQTEAKGKGGKKR